MVIVLRPKFTYFTFVLFIHNNGFMVPHLMCTETGSSLWFYCRNVCRISFHSQKYTDYQNCKTHLGVFPVSAFTFKALLQKRFAQRTVNLQACLACLFTSHKSSQPQPTSVWTFRNEVSVIWHQKRHGGELNCTETENYTFN